MAGHHRPASETPFKWRFAGGPIEARFNVYWVSNFKSSECKGGPPSVSQRIATQVALRWRADSGKSLNADWEQHVIGHVYELHSALVATMFLNSLEYGYHGYNITTCFPGWSETSKEIDGNEVMLATCATEDKSTRITRKATIIQFQVCINLFITPLFNIMGKK